MSNPSFLNTSEIASELNTNNKRITRHAEKLGLIPYGKIKGKSSSHKPGHVWTAKQFRILRRYFSKLVVV